MDIIEQISFGLIACSVGFARSTLGLEAGEKALHCQAVRALGLSPDYGTVAIIRRSHKCDRIQKRQDWLDGLRRGQVAKLEMDGHVLRDVVGKPIAFTVTARVGDSEQISRPAADRILGMRERANNRTGSVVK